MKQKTKKYLCRWNGSIDFTDLIKFYLIDNYDPNLSKEQITEKIIEYMFNEESIAGFHNICKKQIPAVLNKIKELEYERNE